MTRNPNLDFAKAIACIGVVIIHCSFPGMAGKFAVYLFKFAIPVFFMISGFFLFRPDAPTNEKIKALKRKALHIFKILLFAELLSAVFFIAKALVVKECYAFDFSAGDILINCFTGTFFNGTLWFLYALFWSYVLMWIALAVVRFIRNRRTLHPGLAGENTNLLTFNKFTPQIVKLSNHRRNNLPDTCHCQGRNQRQ